MTVAHCSGCKFWSKINASILHGECRRYTPQKRFLRSPSWPITSSGDWCGEFEAKERDSVEVSWQNDWRIFDKHYNIEFKSASGSLELIVIQVLGFHENEKIDESHKNVRTSEEEPRDYLEDKFNTNMKDPVVKVSRLPIVGWMVINRRIDMRRLDKRNDELTNEYNYENRKFSILPVTFPNTFLYWSKNHIGICSEFGISQYCKYGVLNRDDGTVSWGILERKKEEQFIDYWSEHLIYWYKRDHETKKA